MDLRSILPGDDWEAELSAARQTCAVVVLVARPGLGPGRSPTVLAAIDADDDFFRLEMERALDATTTAISGAS